MKFRNATLKLIVVLSCIFTICIMPVFTAAGDVKPKPGDVIDASNIEQYKSYFPEFMQRYIKDGWGIEDPFVIHVKEYEPNPLPESFLKETEKNKGKVKLSSDGSLSGYDYHGAPFADDEIKEPGKVMKIMWNNYYKWKGDDMIFVKDFATTRKRKGGKISYNTGRMSNIRFVGRNVVLPRELENPQKLFWASIVRTTSVGAKDMYILTYRYLDTNQSDDMWAYVPTLRRTLRMISTERSNPMGGSPYTPDDQYGWDGKINEFDYKLIGEATLLNVMNFDVNEYFEKYPNGYPHPAFIGREFPYEVRETYLVEVKPKNPRHPESKRLLWIMKENYMPAYAQMYDKNGEIWKGLPNIFCKIKTQKGETGPFMANSVTDFKTGMWSLSVGLGANLDIGLDPGFYNPGLFFKVE
jgi:hypothetical protein